MAADAARVVCAVISTLESCEIAYHLGGSFASGIYGFARQTNDADIVAEIGEAHVDDFVARLQEAFYVDAEMIRDAILHRASFNVIHLDSGFKVDVFVRGDTPFDRSEFERRRLQPFVTEPPISIFVKSPEDTILRKLLWYEMGGRVSDRQWTDIVGMLKVQAGKLDESYLDRWAAELGLVALLSMARDDA